MQLWQSAERTGWFAETPFVDIEWHLSCSRSLAHTVKVIYSLASLRHTRFIRTFLILLGGVGLLAGAVHAASFSDAFADREVFGDAVFSVTRDNSLATREPYAVLPRSGWLQSRARVQ